MNRLRVTHLLLFIWVVLVCLAPPAGAQGGEGDAEVARRLASAADDNAAGVEARREALGKLEQAAQLALAAGEPLEAARALNRAGRLRLLLNEPQAALDTHRRALSLLEGVPSPEVEADGLSGMGGAYHRLRGQSDAALEALRRAADLSEQVGYTRGRAVALVKLSEVQCPDDHALGLRMAQEALVLWESLGDARGLTRAHAQLGVCYLAQNLLAESERSYESARRLWHELKDKSGQAEALIGLSFVEGRRGEWRRQLSLLTEARGLIDEEAEPQMAGQIAADFGGAFRDSGSPEKGLPHFERALGIYRKLDDPHLISYGLWTLGRAHLAKGDRPAALACFQEALQEALGESLVSPTVGHIDAAAAREYIGKVYIEMGDPAAALPYLQSALAAFEVRGNPGDIAEVRELLGKMYELRGQFEPARENYRAALEGFASLSDRVNQAGVHYDLGRLELGRGNYREAEGDLRRSVELTEDLRSIPISRDLTAAFSATVHERYEAYVECLMRLHAADPSRGLAERAFESSESARARSLSEVLRATETNLLPGLDPGLAERERSLRQSLRFKEDERVGLLGGKYEKSALAALEAELDRLRAEYRSVEEAIRASNPAYVQVTNQAGWDLQRIQEQVVPDHETLLVAYSLGEVRSYAWAVTRGGLVSHELPPRALINRAADRVHTLLARPREGSEEELALALRELSRMVLSPFAEEMRSRRRVIVVADGALNYVPFQLLSASPGVGDEEPLVATHEVVNAPSASVLGQLHEEAARRRPRAKTLAAFGDPIFLSNYAMRKGGGAESAGLRRAEDENLRNRLRGARGRGRPDRPGDRPAALLLRGGVGEPARGGRGRGLVCRGGLRGHARALAGHRPLRVRHPPLRHARPPRPAAPGELGAATLDRRRGGAHARRLRQSARHLLPARAGRAGGDERVPHGARQGGARRGDDRPHARLHVRGGVERGVEPVEGQRRGDLGADEALLREHAAARHDARGGARRGAEQHAAGAGLALAPLLGRLHLAGRVPSGLAPGAGARREPLHKGRRARRGVVAAGARGMRGVVVPASARARGALKQSPVG